MIRDKYILLAFRFVVGGVFIWAGFLKILDPLDFAQNIANYRVFPQAASFFLALVLPWIELACGFFLILGIFRDAASLVLSALIVVFLGLIVATLIRGLDIDCGCFGTISSKVDIKLLLADIVLLFFSFNIFFSKTKKGVAS